MTPWWSKAGSRSRLQKQALNEMLSILQRNAQIKHNQWEYVSRSDSLFASRLTLKGRCIIRSVSLDKERYHEIAVWREKRIGRGKVNTVDQEATIKNWCNTMPEHLNETEYYEGWGTGILGTFQKQFKAVKKWHVWRMTFWTGLSRTPQ